jgi:hypothetical protein
MRAAAAASEDDMHDFHTALADVRKLDPSKRVNYSFGLVLGVDEFLQEQTHLLELHRRHQRMLHGFGTVSGLKVTVPGGVTPVEVRVTPGLAVSPGGFDICVPAVMCADVNKWLAANAQALHDRFGPPPATFGACVVVCYRECPTDVVPVPGEPCRTEEEAMAPSRIADSFELKLCIPEETSPPFDSPPVGSPPSGQSHLCFCPPPSARKTGEFEFGQLLRRIDIDAGAATFSTAAQLEAAVKGILDLEAGGIPSPPPGPLAIDPVLAPEMLSLIVRVWITEVLPELLKRDNETWCGRACGKCVLIADLQIQVAANNTVLGGPSGITVDESRRPLLVATSLMQEWLLSTGPAIV